MTTMLRPTDFATTSDTSMQAFVDELADFLIIPLTTYQRECLATALGRAIDERFDRHPS
jgi:hypothetical protein